MSASLSATGTPTRDEMMMRDSWEVTELFERVTIFFLARLGGLAQKGTSWSRVVPFILGILVCSP
jgi:hypothetical protein